MFPRNDTNGTITTVTPVDTDAGNMNNMLFPAPVPMIATTGLACRTIACNAGFWTLRN
ncbi:hypothetical protein DM02DRAFT_547311, partial [Periconia macrospinosa]